MTFEIPRHISDTNGCYFYHTIDLPEFGAVKGEWDLRTSYRKYLGNYNFQSKSVLEIGPASGFLTFAMEKMGASVTAVEVSDDFLWDFVPYSN